MYNFSSLYVQTPFTILVINLNFVGVRGRMKEDQGKFGQKAFEEEASERFHRYVCLLYMNDGKESIYSIIDTTYSCLKTYLYIIMSYVLQLKRLTDIIKFKF